MDPPVEFVFGGWAPVLRVLFIGTTSYLVLIGILRFAGARTLTNLDPFDFVIIVGLGSTFGRLLTAHEVALTEAVTAFVVLIGLQILSSWLRARHPRLIRATTPQPTLLFYHGQFLRDAMLHERVAEIDLMAAVREHEIGSLDDVEAIVLETNGRLAVVPSRNVGDGSALIGIVPQKDARAQ